MCFLNRQASTDDGTPILAQIIKLKINAMQSNAGHIHNRDDFFHEANPTIKVVMNVNTKPKKQIKKTAPWKMFGPGVTSNCDNNKPPPHKIINR
jgi:hypothetical protein